MGNTCGLGISPHGQYQGAQTVLWAEAALRCARVLFGYAVAGSGSGCRVFFRTATSTL